MIAVDLLDAMLLAGIHLFFPINMMLQFYFVRKTNRVQPEFSMNNLFDLGVFLSVIMAIYFYMTHHT